ncbi:NADPH-dependent FMN reductase [Streptomyces sp. DH37]|uniref:NADPH-dependent FMN reductase n=1 Tax=Streptomyces sp. DH37 TaxID=3040122 RepID=UPI0024410111|nr:NAD(P)H-dependent oxidoreductase [Streptomyces sp. DH37]MDG9702000.1 NAD(P)H-dependent oxidoreductase [Streptomyces sp. DH37]
MRQITRVLGVGGSLRADSTAEKALRVALAEAERLGAEVDMLAGTQLAMPLYDPRAEYRGPEAQRLIKAVAAADGVVLATPAYHGSISGLMKNAIDHMEELRDNERPYLSGRAVGCVAVSDGAQGAVAALGALRDVAHALRGWPTPLGIALDDVASRFGPDGECTDVRARRQLTAMAGQVVEFAVHRKTALGERSRAVGGISLS